MHSSPPKLVAAVAALIFILGIVLYRKSISCPRQLERAESRTSKTPSGGGGNGSAARKAVFVVGGPGSGKTFVVEKLGLPAHGFRVVNIDYPFERLMRGAGLEMTPENIFSSTEFSSTVDGIRKKAKALTEQRQDLLIKRRLGMVIEGTGRHAKTIFEKKAMLEENGYETAMLFVHTDLLSAIIRDSHRPRSIGVVGVANMWRLAQSNFRIFQRAFGTNFYFVDNSTDVDSAHIKG